MQIKYIDSLETEDINVRKGVSRICAWDNKSVALAIEQDTRPNGSFGRLPVSPSIRMANVPFWQCYSYIIFSFPLFCCMFMVNIAHTFLVFFLFFFCSAQGVFQGKEYIDAQHLIKY